MRLNPHMTPGLVIKDEPHWWDASALTASFLLPLLSRQILILVNSFPYKAGMAEAMKQYPDACAVLVRRHGVYVWGETWEKAKAM